MRRGQNVIYRGKHLTFLSRDGWEFVDRPGICGIVVIVAVTAENTLLLTEQHRPPVGRSVIELPAGLAGDTATESLTTAARRELLEETGYVARRLHQLCAGPPSAGVSSEVVTMYLATGLRRTGPGGGDGTERIRLHEVPLGSVDRWLRAKARAGLLVDPKVFAGLYFAGRPLRTR